VGELEDFDLYRFVGSIEVGDGRTGLAAVAVGPAAGVDGGGAALAALGGGGRVFEHQWMVGELLGRLIWVEKGWKEELSSGLGDGSGHGGRRRRSWSLGEPVWLGREEEWRG
jgi:hypothetical protein